MIRYYTTTAAVTSNPTDNDHNHSRAAKVIVTSIVFSPFRFCMFVFLCTC